MGLDITAVSRLKLVSREVPNSYHYPTQEPIYDNLIKFSNSFGERASDLKPGLYEYEGELKFRAGSYSGYGAWRDQLAKLVGFKSADELHHDGKDYPGPFSELINFADNEGYIGPEVSKKLARDFDAFEERAKAQAGWFFELYQIWQQAFHLAADNGFVSFH